MPRTTVEIPDDLDARLRHEAECRGMTVAELTRVALEHHLGAGGGRRHFLAAGTGHSGRRDTSERIKEVLGSEIAPSP